MEYTYRKKIVLILLLTSFYWVISFGQETQKETNDSIEVWIKAIKNEYVKINHDAPKFKIVQEDRNGESAEGGILKKFYDGKSLRKAVLIFFGETGQSTTEYYLLNGELIFVLQTEERYKSPIYMGKVETESQEENKFYFKKEKIIRWINNDGEIVDAGLYPEKQKEFLDDLKTIIKETK